MPNLFLFVVPLANRKYYNLSMILDLSVITLTLVEYFSNDLIITRNLLTVCLLFTVFFALSIIFSLIKSCKGILLVILRTRILAKCPQTVLRFEMYLFGVSFDCEYHHL